MTRFAGIALALAALSACGLMGRGRDDKPRAKPVVENEREPAPQPEPAPEPGKDPAPAPQEPEYVPQDFPAPELEQTGGDFFRGSPMPGFDPYRSPDATSPYQGYYFFSATGPVQKVIKIEEKVEKKDK